MCLRVGSKGSRVALPYELFVADHGLGCETPRVRNLSVSCVRYGK